MSRLTLVTSSFLALSVAACGGGGNSSNLGGDAGDAGVGADGGTGTDGGAIDSGDVDTGVCTINTDFTKLPFPGFPAAHPAHPQVTDQGGKVLSTPKAYLIFFSGYAYEAQLKQFAQTVGATDYWKQATSEYGVGAMTYTNMIEVTDTPAASLTGDQVDTYINGKISSGAFGTPDPNTVYTIFYPSTTTITQDSALSGTSSSCTDFGGYHSDTTVGGVNYAYAVVPTCNNFGGLTGIDDLTGALSHEWAEAATDPFPSTNNGADAAYATVDQDHFVWQILGGGEVGDMCAQRPDAFYKPADVGFEVQRIWSNKAAAAGGDPCLPKAIGPYFNGAPVLNDSVTLGPFGTTKGAKIAQGASKTIEVDLFSDEDTCGPFDVEAIDAATLLSGPTAKPSLTFSWDKTSGQNGDKLNLTITVVGPGPISALTTAHPFVVLAKLGSTQINFWPGLVSEN